MYIYEKKNRTQTCAFINGHFCIKLNLIIKFHVEQFFCMNWAGWSLKYLSTDHPTENTFAFPGRAGGIAGVHYSTEGRPALNMIITEGLTLREHTGVASLSVNSAPATSAGSSWLLNIVTMIPGSISKMVIAMKSFIDTKDSGMALWVFEGWCRARNGFHIGNCTCFHGNVQVPCTITLAASLSDVHKY